MSDGAYFPTVYWSSMSDGAYFPKRPVLEDGAPNDVFNRQKSPDVRVQRRFHRR